MVQAEVVLAAEQRVGALVLEGDTEHLTAEGERVRRLHALPRGGGSEEGVSADDDEVTEAGQRDKAAHTNSKASGVVPMKKPPGRRRSQALRNIMSACWRLSKE